MPTPPLPHSMHTDCDDVDCWHDTGDMANRHPCRASRTDDADDGAMMCPWWDCMAVESMAVESP